MSSTALTRRNWLAFASSSAAAQTSARPSKAIRFVVPFAPGGSSEIVARTAAYELAKLLGQSVYVDNKPGAAGNVAMQEVASATDQHTLTLGHSGTLAVNPFIFDKLPYDPVKDSVERLTADAAIAVGDTPAEFAKFIGVEQQRWKAVIARAKIKPD